MSEQTMNVTTANGSVTNGSVPNGTGAKADLGQIWPEWGEVLGVLRPQVTQATFDTIIKDTIAYRENGRISITVPSDMAKDWLKNRLFYWL